MTIKEFLGTNLRYDNDCQVIYAVQPDGHDQLILDIRGWGRIQHLFPNIKDAAKFQDELGKFYAEAIKEKVERDMNTKTKYLEQICKIGQGAACCRYIVAGGPGITCAKLSGFKATIDARVAEGKFTATADNCEGKPEDEVLTETPVPV